MINQQTPLSWPLDASKVEIDRPDRYWIAVRGDIPWLTMPWLTDPDRDDHRGRHADLVTADR
ncbi:hypothetical protein C5C18_11830 [Rathayibacter tritici]|uniref:hypothetical protein n=1 Tax=Rathayibacter tritici TaxID=33888 RepID=UPI000CE8B3F9|nr:hypothetical protein [Rathayibacter tritici]PPF66167.1 hypothetical protein C5C21_09770 [Rathayibacter tritici]PPG05969.1 hypothetical protein C5C18_11830 [Rathayibacter tritici]